MVLNVGEQMLKNVEEQNNKMLLKNKLPVGVVILLGMSWEYLYVPGCYGLDVGIWKLKFNGFFR